MGFSNRKLIYYFVGIDLCVVLTEVKIYFPIFNSILIILLIPLVWNTLKWENFLKSKSFILFFVCYSILLVCALFDHGPSIYEYVYRFSRLIPLFLAGIIISERTKSINGVILFSIVGLFLGGISLLFEGGSQFIIRNVMTDLSDYLRSPYRYIPPVFVTILSLYLIKETKNTNLKYLIIILSIFNMVSVLRSGFTTPIFVFFVCMFAYLFWACLNLRSHLGKYSLKMIQSIVGIIFCSLVLKSFFAESVVSVRMLSLFDYLFVAESFVDLDYISGTRVTLLTRSFDTFIEYPIIGVGAESLSGIETRVGSHSSIFDLLAQFGIFGFAFILMLLSWIFISYKLSLKSRAYSNISVAFFCVWVGYFAGCISNPYFLSAAIDHYIFVFAGITVGLNYKYNYGSKKPGIKRS